jgi:hypothetical protein
MAGNSVRLAVTTRRNAEFAHFYPVKSHNESTEPGAFSGFRQGTGHFFQMTANDLLNMFV